MVALTALWLPIVVAAVFVFLASSVIHMALPIHKNDYTKLDAEPEVMAAMREHGVKPGAYFFPCAQTMAEMTSPEMIEKLNKGPVGFMTVLPNGPMNMGKSLGQWFAFSLVISIFAAYVGTFTLEAGADYMAVFRVTGTVAFLGYGVSNVTDSIWKGVRWSVTAKFLFDGLIYGLVTAGTFGWLWPSA